WLKFIKSAKQPELPVVLLEDVGAEIGLLLALGGVITAHYTHNPRWDAVGSISIGVLLIIIAAFLAIEMKGLLIGESALDSEVASIRTAILSHHATKNVIHLRTEHLSPDDLLVATKVEFDHSLSVHELSKVIDEIEVLIRAQVPSAHFIFIEPDIAHSTILN
ncbi:MAG: cation transporter, partial [Actinobacteria bacterium]|nr:cation transporter [Actinomycetota bacterium]